MCIRDRFRSAAGKAVATLTARGFADRLTDGGVTSFSIVGRVKAY